MTRIVRQYYEAPGAPMDAPATATQVAAAWIQHRDRVRTWLHELPEDAWDHATRCSGWSVTGLVEHLISGAQFLGYTLHQSVKGAGTNLLASFDPQETPAATAAQFAGLRRSELLAALDEVDARVATELAVDGRDWAAPAEAPPGRVCARLSVNHFLFDSWVHERDLMIPAGVTPILVPEEAAAVLSYVLAIAGVARWADDTRPTPAILLDVVAEDLGICVAVARDGTGATMTRCAEPDAHQRVAGTVSELVDFATGRCTGDGLRGDPDAVAFLANLAQVMS